MLIGSLKKLGFSEKEAQVYLTLLKVGPSPASALANRVGLKRVTIYSVLDSLREIGVVGVENDDQCRKYIPYDPECLARLLEDQSMDLKRKLAIARGCIDDLRQISTFTSHYRDEASFFRGCNAIKNVLVQKLNSKEPLFVLFANFGSGGRLDACFGEFLESFAGKSHKVFVIVPEHVCDKFNRGIKGVKFKSVKLSYPIDSNLILQGDTVFFLFSVEDEVSMLYVVNPKYASFLRELLFTSHFGSID